MMKFSVITTLLVFSMLKVQAENLPAQISKTYSEVDQKLYDMSHKNDIVKGGRQIFESVCFACHGKNLEGATGPNLRDGEWLHGSKPSEILKSISKGFPEKGMLNFDGIYKPQQVESVVAYLLSKQQGLREVSYQLYHDYKFDPVINESKSGTKNFMKSPIPDLSQARPAKQGELKKNLLDVFIAEVMTYAVNFEAFLLVPETGEYSLNFASRLMPSELSIDGKKIVTTEDPKFKTKAIKKLTLERGYHAIQAKYFKMGGTKTPRLFFTWSGPGFENESLSWDSKKMEGVEHIVEIENRARVFRVSMGSMPSGTLYIGHPQKLHYAFHPKTASVLGTWTGSYLDIGGAITERSRQPAIPLGQWLFKSKPGLQIQVGSDKPEIDFKGYQLVGESVVIDYIMNLDRAIEVRLQAKATNVSTMTFQYQLSAKPKESLSFELPANAKIHSKDGFVKDGVLSINSDKSQNFSINVTK